MNQPSDQPASTSATVFQAVGGQPTFERIVQRFYDGVENDSSLRPMYPSDLTEARRHLLLFLVQYFGGPGTYSQQRGHPRLRMRHLPFSIGQAERDAWVKHMRAAVKAENLPLPLQSVLLEYFERTATFMMNRRGE